MLVLRVCTTVTKAIWYCPESTRKGSFDLISEFGIATVLGTCANSTNIHNGTAPGCPSKRLRDDTNYTKTLGQPLRELTTND